MNGTTTIFALLVPDIGENKKNIMKRKIVYTDAPPEIEEAIENGRIIPNFIDINSLVRRDGTRPSFVTSKSNPLRTFKKVAAML